MKNYYIILCLLIGLLACSGSHQYTLDSQILTQFEGSSIRGVQVNQDGVIWIAGSKGLIAYSEEEGLNWVKVNMPDDDSLDFRSIITLPAGEVIIASAGYPARIYKTNSKGNTWDKVYENLDSAAFINTLLYNSTYELYYAFGDIIHKKHLILKSNDKGNSWEKVDHLPEAEKGENGFAASNACMVFHHNKMVIGLGGEKGRMLVSQDLGESWHFSETPRENTTPYEGVYALASNKKKLVAVGGDFSIPDTNSEIIWSTDGLNWQLAYGPSNGYRSTVIFNPYHNVWLSAGTNGVDISESAEVWKKISDLDLNVLANSPNGRWLLGVNSKGEVFKLTLH